MRRTYITGGQPLSPAVVVTLTKDVALFGSGQRIGRINIRRLK